MSREAATSEVRRAVDGSGLNRTQFAAKAGIDAGTLGDFLEGRRWAQGPTRSKIERALGWPAGRIGDIERNGSLPIPGIESAEEPVIQAILEDPRLLPEAKAHLVNQYGLLLRVQAAGAREAQEEQAARDEQLARLKSREKGPASKPTKAAPRKTPTKRRT